jgi:hypothetical protein
MYAGLIGRQGRPGKVKEYWPIEKPVNGRFEVCYTYRGDPKTYSVFIEAETREKAHDRFYEVNHCGGYIVLRA